MSTCCMIVPCWRRLDGYAGWRRRFDGYAGWRRRLVSWRRRCCVGRDGRQRLRVRHGVGAGRRCAIRLDWRHWSACETTRLTMITALTANHAGRSNVRHGAIPPQHPDDCACHAALSKRARVFAHRRQSLGAAALGLRRWHPRHWRWDGRHLREFLLHHRFVRARRCDHLLRHIVANCQVAGQVRASLQRNANTLADLLWRLVY